MPIYEYKNEKTGELIDRMFSMEEEIPEVIVEEGEVYNRVFGNASFHIPFQWSTTNNRPKYNQSPSGKKRIW